MRKKILLFSSLFITFATPSFCLISDIKTVVLWGHKLHTHTHSYIHWGFYRAFESSGYKTYWFDNSDNISGIDFSNTLFITEGQVDQRIPILDDCYYVIHNCNPDKYTHLLSNGHAIILQVYTHDCLARNEPSFDFCFHYDLSKPIIYMPWATDLLPHEINTVKQRLIDLPENKQNTAMFVGTISGGSFGNTKAVDEFKRGCNELGIKFVHGGISNLSMEQNIALIQSAKLAPALQGEWQCKQGYIPCRIFKNISYGSMGITNSKTVYDLFKGKIVYNADSHQLCHDAIKRLRTFNSQELFELMDFVRDNHTYLNRIQTLLSFFEKAYQHKVATH